MPTNERPVRDATRAGRLALYVLAVVFAAAAFAQCIPARVAYGEIDLRPQAERRHPVPDVYFFYDVVVERDTIGILHETRWNDAAASELRVNIDTNEDEEISREEALAFGRAWLERVKRSFSVELNDTPLTLVDPEINYYIHYPSDADVQRAAMLPDDEEAEVSKRLYQGTTWEFTIYLDFEVSVADLVGEVVDPVQLRLLERTYQDDEPELVDVPEAAIIRDQSSKEEPKTEIRPWATNAISVRGGEGLSIFDGSVAESRVQVTQEISFNYDFSGRGPSTFSFEEFVDPNDELGAELEKLIGSDWPILSWPFLAALAIAFGYGAGHALAPGHGKAMVAAYLVGTRGRRRDAAYLGAVVTITHTLSVVILAILCLIALNSVESKLVQQWASIASGVGLILMGIWLFTRNLRSLVTGEPIWHGHSHGHAPAEPAVAPAHDHAHGHSHAHEHGHAHAHGHAHDHGLAHAHEHEHGHAHGHVHEPADAQSHDHAHAHTQPAHSHGHDHRMPASLREVLVLGVTGGIVPCPGALIAFLGSLQIGLHYRGLLVMFAFSLGLASVLIAIGMTLVTSTALAERLSGGSERFQTVTRVLPVISAIAIIIVGCFITYTALTTGPKVFG